MKRLLIAAFAAIFACAARAQILPASVGTPIVVTTSGVTGTLPSGTVVVASNVGSNTAYCALGASSSTAQQPIPAGGWFAFNVGSATQLTCLTSTGTTTINMVGGYGQPTGAGGGGSGGGGGGGSVPTGSAGSPTASVVSVQGVSGGTGIPVTGTFWPATQPVSLASLPALVAGSATIGAVTQASGPWTMNLTQVDGTALGAPANYGTSPGAVKVPGVNAYVTNTPAVSQSGTWTVQPGNTANTTPWLVTPSLQTISHAHATSLVTSLVVKASAGNLLGFYCNAITGGASWVLHRLQRHVGPRDRRAHRRERSRLLLLRRDGRGLFALPHSNQHRSLDRDRHLAFLGVHPVHLHDRNRHRLHRGGVSVMSRLLTLLCALIIASPCWATSGLLNPIWKGQAAALLLRTSPQPSTAPLPETP